MLPDGVSVCCVCSGYVWCLVTPKQAPYQKDSSVLWNTLLDAFRGLGCWAGLAQALALAIGGRTTLRHELGERHECAEIGEVGFATASRCL